jgi:uncharacterized protein YcbK (DUF882 family)
MILSGGDLMATLEQLQQFLDENGIVFFSARELVKGLNNDNKVPSESIWGNALPTLRLLDKARQALGKIRINSGYRCPEYNQKVGGASASMHLFFKACDIKPLDCSLDELQNFLLSNIPSDSWGLKRYKNFIHIDCRRQRYRSL